MNYFTVTKYNENLYQLKDKLGVLVTLVIGNEKALLFDTAYGIGDLKKEVEQITKLPLVVVNSHGHMDHSCGNYQFDEVLINEKDFELCKKHNSLPWRRRNVASAKAISALPEGFDEEKYLGCSFGNLKPLNYHDIIDLGNLELEVIDMRGHTQGSIGLYIKDWKLLLVGDATCPFIWIFLDESTSVEEYIEMLENVLPLDFTDFLVGHGARLFPKSKMYEFLKVAKEVDMEKAVKVSFNNFEEHNIYCYTEGVMYNQDHAGIVFDPNKLKRC